MTTQDPKHAAPRPWLWWGALVLALSACGSKDNDNAPKPSAGGAPTDAGSQADGGLGGACTTTAAAVSSPNLNGKWAWRTVASRYVPKTGLTDAFYTRTVSVLLVEQTASGSSVTMNATYCDQTAEDPDALAHVVIPNTFKRALKDFTRVGTYAEDDQGATVLTLPSFVEVVGANLDDDVNEPLPETATDPAVVDQDEDGNPGMTIKLSGLVSGDLYVVQRQDSTLTGVFVSKNRIEGHYAFTSEQVVLESNPANLKDIAAQTAVTDPTACNSTFVMVRVPEDATCASLLSDLTLFD